MEASVAASHACEAKVGGLPGVDHQVGEELHDDVLREEARRKRVLFTSCSSCRWQYQNLHVVRLSLGYGTDGDISVLR